MKIAYRHLVKFFADKPDIQDLSNKLFQLGHEHEINDSIFDMEFTPNRGDCLSLHGLIRDLNVFYKTNTETPIYMDDLPVLDLNFINQAQDQCPQISFLNVEIKGEIAEYKDYLLDYFKDYQINKNNFFTDISNYVAYEMGQPTHCYEFSSIGNDITLKENKNVSKFTTLLNSTIEIKIPDLVFTSDNKIINLAGVMGGMETSCNMQTKNVLIECAYFKPESIIGKALKYNLHSEASHKFERGTDPSCHEKVLRRFIQIIEDHAEIIKVELFRNNNKILGLNTSEAEYKNSLNKLGFEVDKIIKVPFYRNDISHQNDLAEELARVIGYDNIPIKSLNLKNIPTKLNTGNDEKIKLFLIDNGFTEVINSPFCSASNLNSIKVDNPLDSNRQYLRLNLTNSLVENLIYNEKRQKDSIKLFEIADIYTSDINNYEKRLAIIISGRRGQNYLDFSKKLDNKYLINLFKQRNINIEKFISNIDRNKIDSKIKTPIFAIELKIEDLIHNFSEYIGIKEISNQFIKYDPISEFPSSYRDLSFSVKDSSKISEVINALSDTKLDILKSSFMFDFYENTKTNESKIGFRFIFQSSNRTLTDTEIDDVMLGIIEPVLSIKSVSLPGVY